MKKISFLLLCLIMNIETFAQTSKFFLNGATAAGSKADCATLKQLSVSFPVPSNVSTFDCYFISLHLSSLDVPAYIFFDKDDIKAKLTGKKEYKAYVLKTDGSSDFTFDDNELSAKDLCFTPRMWNMPTLDLELEGTGNKIIGYHWEESYDEDKAKWIKTQVPDWDEGETHGSGTFELVQRPVADGIEDATEFLKVKPVGGDHVSFGEPDVYGTETTISISDTSLGIPVEFTWCVYDAATYPKEKIKEEVLAAFNGKQTQTAYGTVTERSNLFGAAPDAFKYMSDLSFDHKQPVKGSTTASFQPVSVSGKPFELAQVHQVHFFRNETYSYKLNPGMYIQCYVGEVSGKTVVIMAAAQETIAEEFLHTAFQKDYPASEQNAAWFSAKITDAKISSLEGLMSKTVSATIYLQ